MSLFSSVEQDQTAWDLYSIHEILKETTFLNLKNWKFRYLERLFHPNRWEYKKIKKTSNIKKILLNKIKEITRYFKNKIPNDSHNNITSIFQKERDN